MQTYDKGKIMIFGTLENKRHLKEETEFGVAVQNGIREHSRRLCSTEAMSPSTSIPCFLIRGMYN